MAMFRCSPTHSRRPIFNWLHWLVGCSAHVLGVIAVFLAVSLPAAQLPFWTYWLLAGFVVFHVMTHLLLSVSGGRERVERGKGRMWMDRDC